jgi:hypothetical protein
MMCNKFSKIRSSVYEHLLGKILSQVDQDLVDCNVYHVNLMYLLAALRLIGRSGECAYLLFCKYLPLSFISNTRWIMFVPNSKHITFPQSVHTNYIDFLHGRHFCN